MVDNDPRRPFYRSGRFPLAGERPRLGDEADLYSASGGRIRTDWVRFPLSPLALTSLTLCGPVELVSYPLG
jgi:hypothetical protein